MPEPREISVDQTTPEFQAALEREMDRLEAEGVRDLLARATQNVTSAFRKAEKARESERLALLVEALEALESPRGCWAYTVTTTVSGKFGDKEGDGYKIESFDPSEPIETAWTLVSRNGKAPNEEQQAEYRRDKVRSWERQLRAHDSKSYADHFLSKTRLGRRIAFDVQEDDGRLTYGFETPEMSIPLLLRFAGTREEYVLDQATGELRGRRLWTLGPLVRLTRRIDHFDWRTEYATLHEGLPPFRVKERIQAKERDQIDGVVEFVFTDYRRVTCYDERFQVEMPELEFIEFIPGFN